MTRDEIIAAVREGRSLSGAYLIGANLSGANLSGANLIGANLSRAYLSRAYLSGAYLIGANLSRAYLSGADLSGADLSGADLSGADLSRADLSRADLRGAKIGEHVLKRLAGRAGRSDGYEFLLFEAEASHIIRAGCRTFNLDEFEAHVAANYEGDPKAAETRRILAFLADQLNGEAWS